MSCYAANLGDCAGGLSGEHYISESVLEAFGGAYTLEGAAWQRRNPHARPTGSLPYSAFTANCLCRHHNAELGALDDAAAELARQMRRMFDERNSYAEGHTVCAPIDGVDLSRWVLKAISGAAAGRIMWRDGKQLVWSPDEAWNRLLFGRVEIPRGCGLVVLRSPESVEGAGFKLVPAWSNGAIVGGVVGFMDVQLHCVVSPQTQPVLRDRNTGVETHGLLRPRHLRFKAKDGSWSFRIPFNWPRGTEAAGGILYEG